MFLLLLRPPLSLVGLYEGVGPVLRVLCVIVAPESLLLVVRLGGGGFEGVVEAVVFFRLLRVSAMSLKGAG